MQRISRREGTNPTSPCIDGETETQEGGELSSSVREPGSSLDSPWLQPAAAFSQKASPGPTLLQKEVGLGQGGRPPASREGVTALGASSIGSLPSVPLPLVYPRSHQKDGKEKQRVQKNSQRSVLLFWGSEAPSSSTPSGTRPEACPPVVEPPALPAPHSAPTPGLELPGFFPGSGISRGCTRNRAGTGPSERI